MLNNNKQRGAAAIEYAILAAAMAVVLLNFVGGENGELTTAINEAYSTVVEKLKDVQQTSQ
ncbi:Flp family type IVb pilin [Vibrio sagamiensis]|uniref:Pilin n=1 Tax=Vibrio sagamiensis NBRC 104589 TaxID=1219064 RepID=A0A511QGZ0_9VIBR|nr:Flp family type IVb pilin [Vibrio sagamiensis]PNQ67664.1 Flp family type IVb pilin [Vibrio agarivorans]GEM75712.1 hypothetical protein VSA01S_18240 [Vibrio sagamiensis NBRC 104589]